MKRRKLPQRNRLEWLIEAFAWLGGTAFRGYLVDLLVALIKVDLPRRGFIANP